MSGIYAHLVHKETNAENGRQFLQIVRNCSCRMPTDSVVELEASALSGAVIHHGVFRSAGAVSSPDGRWHLLIAGTAWLDDQDTLAKPMEILDELIRNEDRHSLKGNYAYILYDSRTKQLVVENDLFGVYPIYYRHLPGGIAVASEIKVLADLGPCTHNAEALAEMLHFGYLVRPHTFLNEIHRLAANHRLEFSPGNSHLRVRSFPDFPRSEPVTAKSLAQLGELFERSIARYKADTDHFSISLSAGLDSRLVALAADTVGCKMEATSSGEHGSLEVRVAGEFAQNLGIPFHGHVVKGQRFADWFQRAVWISEGRSPPEHMHFMDALLTGDYLPQPQLHGLGGDMVVGGDFDVLSLQNAKHDELRAACLNMMQGFVYWPHNTSQLSFAPQLAKSFAAARENTGDWLLNMTGFSGQYKDFLQSRYCFRLNSFTTPALASQVLPWTDIVTPFLDPAFYSFCASLQAEPLLERITQIRWGLQQYRTFGSVPRVKDGIVLSLDKPDPTVYDRGWRRLRRKNRLRYLICRLSQGRINLPVPESYPVYGHWYRRFPEIRQFVASILLSDQSLDRGLWQREGIQALMHDTRIGRNSWAALGTILTCEIFLRQFQDGMERPDSILQPPIPW